MLSGLNFSITFRNTHVKDQNPAFELEILALHFTRYDAGADPSCGHLDGHDGS